MRNDVTVVIRSVGERTERACAQIIANQVPSTNIHIVKESPFSAAVRKTYSIGAETRLKWTLAVDADILLSTNAIDEMVAMAERKPAHMFAYQGCVLDKLFNDLRPGGPHLYRSDLLNSALKFVSDSPGNLRPESFTYAKMAEIGSHFYQDRQIYGVHDFEQYSGDLFRKGFFHAKKHAHLAANFMSEWLRSDDPDHKVAMSGFVKGLAFDEQVFVDHNFFLGLTEKMNESFLEKSGFNLRSGEVVDEIIATFLAQRPNALKDVKLRESTFQNRKLFGGMMWYLGNRLEQLGKKLKQKSFTAN